LRPNVLTIAGSDGSGGAGIQADLKTLKDLDIHGLSVISCITAQGPSGIINSWAMDETQLRGQARALYKELPMAAVKIGLIGGDAQIPWLIEVLREIKSRNSHVKVVLDPVLQSTSGFSTLKGEVESLYPLFPYCDLITPNLPEAESLTGIILSSIESKAQISHRKKAAYHLMEQGVKAVLIKGGHGEGSHCRDSLYLDNREIHMDYPKRQGVEVHGTGCVLSSAIAAFLARGKDMEEAARSAGEYMQKKIIQAKPLLQFTQQIKYYMF
jgi:hydroxymethylpyrimidine/phosphomethylpyrimidine kinase